MSEEKFTKQELDDWESRCGATCSCGNYLACEECEDEIAYERDKLEKGEKDD